MRNTRKYAVGIKIFKAMMWILKCFKYSLMLQTFWHLFKIQFRLLHRMEFSLQYNSTQINQIIYKIYNNTMCYFSKTDNDINLYSIIIIVLKTWQENIELILYTGQNLNILLKKTENISI